MRDNQDIGWVAEWLKAPVLKTGNGKPFVGSNPTPSANLYAQMPDLPNNFRDFVTPVRLRRVTAAASLTCGGLSKGYRE